jgi:prepilin-type N-terminal cleavage/methylation domain-containing protein
MRSSNKGFTLIELLIVVVIIGLLAAIAIPKFANTKGKAVLSAMRSDLRNLASVQETYWTNNQTYYAGVVPDLANFQFSPTQGVTITIAFADPSGWSATAAAPGLTAQTCAIFYGTTPPIPPATVDAAVACS